MINNTVTDTFYDQLSAAFQSQELLALDAHTAQLKKNAFEDFEKKGFPTVKNEDWKYTNIHKLVHKDYALESGAALAEINVENYKIPNLDCFLVVFVNGEFQKNLSQLEGLSGLELTQIAEVENSPIFKEHFNKVIGKDASSLVDLNTALYRQGIFIHAPKNAELAKPIHILHVNTGNKNSFSQNRNLFVFEQHSNVEIIETFVGEKESSASLFNNSVNEIVVKEGANIQHYYIQHATKGSNYVSHTEIYQEKNSLYNNFNFNFPGADFVRRDINVRLDDENVESHLYGINLTSEGQFVDNHTIVDHMKPHSESYEWYKNITQDESTVVFNGKIFVREDAQKTNAFQQNNNLMIGDKTAIYTKPQLEIFADDVKCSHGCTMGQFDQEALFYLRSRGISEEKGRTLLIHAFAFDVTSKVENEQIRAYAENLLEEGLQI